MVAGAIVVIATALSAGAATNQETGAPPFQVPPAPPQPRGEPRPAPVPPGPELSLSEVKEVALKGASFYEVGGEASVSTLSVARGEQGAAELAMNDVEAGKEFPEEPATIFSHEPVFVVVMQGHFSFREVSMSSGGASERAPTASVLTLVVNAHSGHVAQTQLGPKGPNLDKVGPVVTLEAKEG